MTPEHEDAIRRAAVLGYRLAAIEQAVEYAETSGNARYLPVIIRQHIAAVEPQAPHELACARRIVRGIYE